MSDVFCWCYMRGHWVLKWKVLWSSQTVVNIRVHIFVWVNRTIIPEICSCDAFWFREQPVLFLVFIIVQFASNRIWWLELQASYLERVDLSLCVCVCVCDMGYKTEFLYKYICV